MSIELPVWENSPETPITAEDLNAYTEAIKELQNRDYIVESGVSNSWNYEKLSNGTIRCWRIYGFIPETTGMVTKTISYPFEFTENPVVTISDYTNSTIFTRVRYGDAGGNNENPTSELKITFDNINTTGFYAYACINVISKWK
jgi:hypothetical protein